MKKTKLVLGIAAGLLVALLAGWIWGASGRSAMAGALQASELRGDLLGARAAVLDARVAIYSLNFGEASSHLEGARGLLGRADERVKSRRTSDAMQIEAAPSTMRNAWRGSWIRVPTRVRARRRRLSPMCWTMRRRGDDEPAMLAVLVSAGLAQRLIANVCVAVSDASCKRI